MYRQARRTNMKGDLIVILGTVETWPELPLVCFECVLLTGLLFHDPWIPMILVFWQFFSDGVAVMDRSAGRTNVFGDFIVIITAETWPELPPVYQDVDLQSRGHSSFGLMISGVDVLCLSHGILGFVWSMIRTVSVTTASSEEDKPVWRLSVILITAETWPELRRMHGKISLYLVARGKII